MPCVRLPGFGAAAAIAGSFTSSAAAVDHAMKIKNTASTGVREASGPFFRRFIEAYGFPSGVGSDPPSF